MIDHCLLSESTLILRVRDSNRQVCNILKSLMFVAWWSSVLPPSTPRSLGSTHSKVNSVRKKELQNCNSFSLCVFVLQVFFFIYLSVHISFNVSLPPLISSLFRVKAVRSQLWHLLKKESNLMSFGEGNKMKQFAQLCVTILVTLTIE